MQLCKRCQHEKPVAEFYKSDNTCKECRKALVRANRAAKIEYYREYDKKRFQDDPAVRARHKAYAETEKGKESRSRATQKYIERNPLKRAAHIIVGNAVRDGKIVNPGVYETCGSVVKIEAHHDDYTKPLEVRWMCQMCHKQWHRTNTPVYGV